MSGAFSAIGAFWTYVSTLLDPFCGPVGLFSLFGNGTLVACGDAGWGDEIAFGVKVTITLALATLPVGLTQLQNNDGLTNWGPVMAATVLAMLPMLVVFLLLQRHMIKGLTSGAVKG